MFDGKQKIVETKFFSRSDWLILTLLLMIALLWRCISLVNSQLINHDGFVYLLQAKAFYFQQPEMYLKVYPFPTNLSFMIAGLFYCLKDWILAGRLISVFFGVLTVLPLYLLTRRFWQLPTAFIIVLIYSVSPTFVEFSRDILRGPPFWFFYTLGLLLFCRYLESYDRRFLVAVVLVFLISAWSRIEGLIPLSVAGLWLLFDRRSRCWSHVASYFLPLLLVGLALSCLLWLHPAFNLTFKPIQNCVWERVTALFHNYFYIKQALRDLANNPPLGTAPYFFKESRHLLWFTALGVVGRCLVRAFSWPLILLCLVGLWQRRGAVVNAAQNRGRLFLSLMMVGGFLVFYGYVLLSWASSERFSAIIFFPFLIFLGFGIKKIVAYLNYKVRLQNFNLYILLGMFLIVFSIPSIFEHSHRYFKIPFKSLGQQLAAEYTSKSEMRIWSATKAGIYTYLYATMSQAYVRPLREQYKTIRSCDIDEKLLRQGAFDYLIVLEKDGSYKALIQAMRSENVPSLHMLIETRIPKYGRVYLYGR